MLPAIKSIQFIQFRFGARTELQELIDLIEPGSKSEDNSNPIFQFHSSLLLIQSISQSSRQNVIGLIESKLELEWNWMELVTRLIGNNYTKYRISG